MRTYAFMSGLDYAADFLTAVTAVLLLQARGFTSAEVFAAVAGIWIAEGLFEIPTGVVADMLGRRNSVVMSFAIRVVGYLIVFFAHGVSLTVAGLIVVAIGGTFYSGALEAWAVDEAGARGSGALDALLTRGRVAENVGLVSGTLAGAVLGGFALAQPQVAAAAACAVAAAAGALLMHESPRGADERAPHAQSRRPTLSEIRDVVAITFRHDVVLVWLTIVSALVWLFRGIPGVQWTVFFDHVAGGNLVMLGVMRSAGSLLEIPLLIAALRLQRTHPKLRRALIVGPTAMGALFLTTAALAPSPAVRVVAYILFTPTLGLCMPGIRAAINERASRLHRASTLSVVSLFNSFATAAALIGVGSVVTDLGSVAVTWPLAALGFACAGLAGGFLAALPVVRRTAVPD